MPDIQITIDIEDAAAMLPLIEEQAEAQSGTVAGALWRSLHAAIESVLPRPTPPG